MKYTYAYKTSDGTRHEDAMDAASREAVFESLRARGIRAIKVVAADGSKANGEEKQGSAKIWKWVAVALLILLSLVSYLSRSSHSSHPSATPRHQIYGDPEVMEAFERGDFGDALPRDGDRMLAAFAQPGRLMRQPGADSGAARMAAFAAYARDELAPEKDLPVAESDGRETRELKQIVNGMREEMREYLANGNGTPRSYWQRLNERTARESEIYERTRRELEREDSLEVREERNAALRRLGIRTIPAPRKK